MTKRVLLAIAFAFVGLMLGLTFANSALGVSLATAAGVGLAMVFPMGAADRLGVAGYAWRLIPANPILLRVVESGGKRTRDLIIRCGYLGLLIGWVIFLLLTAGDTTAGGDLSTLAKTSSSIFQSISYVQLALVALLAPIFTAGAITQEKDSQTYDILLATPLTNGQVVLGSLLSRLFFIISLLVSGIPIFSITQIFGGVAIKSIALSFGIAAATAFVNGALAMAIATFKVGTRRTIFSFYLFIVIYLVGGIVLDKFPQFHIPGRTVQQGVESHISWFTGINPFLALKVIFNDPTYAPPNWEDAWVQSKPWPFNWYLSNPTGFYIAFMFFLSFVMVMPSIMLLRRMAQSTTSLKTLVLQKLHITSGDKTKKPRPVWSNPIAWREAKTKASAARATLLRYGFIAAGVIAALFLVVRFSRVLTPQLAVAPTDYLPNSNQISIKGAIYRLPLDTSKIEVESASERDASDKPVNRPFDLSLMRTTMEVVSFKTVKQQKDEDAANGTTTPGFGTGSGYPGGNTWQAGNPQRTPSGRPRASGTGSVLRDPALAGGPPTDETTLASIVLRPPARSLPPDTVRQYLLGLCVVEFAVILLIVTNAAASTVTREKEDGTLDLLLSSPITSRYYIWGKLRGLVSFVLPLVAVPVVSALIFVTYDTFRRMGSWDDPAFEWTVFPEAVLLLPGMLIIVSAFAAILGMQMSLRCRTTVMAVMSSVGIVVGVCAAMGWCGYSLLNSSGRSGNWFSMAAGSFSPFTLMQMLIAPSTTGGNYHDIASEDMSGRLTIIFFTLIAVGAYTAVVWTMYTSMVKNFDMTIRKQSR